ncbi:MAG: choice-of-anchor J domain-containing protein [Chitinophagaceae bacterium]
MKKKYIIKAISLVFISFLCLSANAQISTLNEHFNNYPPSNWVIINHSEPVGVSWFKGHPNAFPAHSGMDSAYIAADFTSTAGDTGTISNWLITPVLLLQNGAVLKFWTSTIPGSPYPDRLEVRLSTADTSTNIGDSAFSVGDFSTLLTSINPGLDSAAYPEQWTEFIDTISGVKEGATGRIAFRYFVTDGGAKGVNSNYVGIDDVSYNISTLPVSFINFDGLIQNGEAVLNWSTSNEINNKGFEVQKSLNGETFTSIGFVQGADNTPNINNYSFTDAKLLSGLNYYRLKQIDFDGRFSYSSTIKLDFSKFNWTILGNPSRNSWIQLQIDKPANISIQIISLNGKIIQTINKGNISQGTYSVPINLSNFAPGIYIVKLIADNQTYSKKIIK